MKILTSGRSRQASAARASASWRERVFVVNSTTPWLMIVRRHSTQGDPSSRRSVTPGRLITRSPEPPSPPRPARLIGQDRQQPAALVSFLLPLRPPPLGRRVEAGSQIRNGCVLTRNAVPQRNDDFLFFGRV